MLLLYVIEQAGRVEVSHYRIADIRVQTREEKKTLESKQGCYSFERKTRGAYSYISLIKILFEKYAN